MSAAARCAASRAGAAAGGQWIVGLVVVGLALAASGCSARADERARREARELLAAIEAVRSASNPDKARALQRLQRFSCDTTREVCEPCKRAFADYVDALPRREELPAEPTARLDALARAEAGLRAARDALERCTTLEFALAARWGLEVTERPAR